MQKMIGAQPCCYPNHFRNTTKEDATIAGDTLQAVLF